MVKLVSIKLVTSILCMNLIWQTTSLHTQELNRQGKINALSQAELQDRPSQMQQSSSSNGHTATTQQQLSTRLQALVPKQKAVDKENGHLSDQTHTTHHRPHNTRQLRQAISCNEEGRTNIQHWCEAAARQEFVNGDNSFCSLCRYYVINYMENCLAYELSVNVSGVCIRPNGTVECIFGVIVAKAEIARCYSQNERGGVTLSPSTTMQLQSQEANDTQCCQLYSTLNTSVPYDIQFNGEIEPALVQPWSDSNCSSYPSVIGEEVCDALPTAATKPTTEPTTVRATTTASMETMHTTATVGGDTTTAQTNIHTTNNAVNMRFNFIVIVSIAFLHLLRLLY